MENKICLTFLPGAAEEAALAAATVYFNRIDPENNYRLQKRPQYGFEYAGIVKQVIDRDGFRDVASVDAEDLETLAHTRDLYEIETIVRNLVIELRQYENADQKTGGNVVKLPRDSDRGGK